MFIFLCIQYHHPEIATVNIFQIRLNFVSLPMEFKCPPPDFPVNSQGTCILMVTSYAEHSLRIWFNLIQTLPSLLTPACVVSVQLDVSLNVQPSLLHQLKIRMATFSAHRQTHRYMIGTIINTDITDFFVSITHLTDELRRRWGLYWGNANNFTSSIRHICFLKSFNSCRIAWPFFLLCHLLGLC